MAESLRRGRDGPRLVGATAGAGGDDTETTALEGKAAMTVSSAAEQTVPMIGGATTGGASVSAIAVLLLGDGDSGSQIRWPTRTGSSLSEAADG